MSSKWVQLKEEGNRAFQQGDYARAEALYSKAIIADPTNPTLYTNRAMTRVKMGLLESAIADCNECLRISPENMKANYQLSLAYQAMHLYDDALEHALRAYDLCVKTPDKSLGAVLTQVLRCKKERWEDQERRRKRDTSELEFELLSLMERERDLALRSDEVRDTDRPNIEEEWARKIQTMRNVFEKARANTDKRRNVPDWAIDNITFGFMHDPVVTKTGKSYERSSLIEHLKRSPTDPITREPLYISELRPNLNLKEACEEFLRDNGWVVDW